MKKLLLSLLAVLCMGAVYAQTPAFTVDFTQKDAWPGVNAYGEKHVSYVAFGGSKWTIDGLSNFNNDWDYVRGGAKSKTSYPSIYSVSSIADAITTVGVNITEFRNGEVKECSLEVSDNANFTGSSKYIYSGDLKTLGEWKIEVNAPAENQYYRVVLTCYNPKSSNGVVSLNKVNFYVDSNTALGAVEAVEGEASYFNLQGQRVANPENGKLYIRVQGGKAMKVIL